ncbi:hypothetical protein M0813_26106 [Anaeramoeba flamelloides]|uniref:Uncharacterized protein n=1 Tax=Anaeramoeba flamelloides TaxID=1746091 RepID=A0ABQ8Y2P5_9EUKA|nr:hypothetical protein M0813_26106 [Anaeramoeba flamelloides]
MLNQVSPSAEGLSIKHRALNTREKLFGSNSNLKRFQSNYARDVSQIAGLIINVSHKIQNRQHHKGLGIYRIHFLTSVTIKQPIQNPKVAPIAARSKTKELKPVCSRVLLFSIGRNLPAADIITASAILLLCCTWAKFSAKVLKERQTLDKFLETVLLDVGLPQPLSLFAKYLNVIVYDWDRVGMSISCGKV